MPKYLYKCPRCGLLRVISHMVDYAGSVECETCQGDMVKKPQSVAVVWHGNKPSDGGVTPYVEQMIADAPRQRDELQARKEYDHD